MKLPGSATLAGIPRTLAAEFNVEIESKVIEPSPLRSRTDGSIAIHITDPTGDTAAFHFETEMTEEKDGPPGDVFVLVRKLFDQAALAFQGISFPTTRPMTGK